VTEPALVRFSELSRVLERNGRTIWLGQSVDTSTIHTAYEDFATIPILTSVGCVMRRPKANAAKFDATLRSRLGAKERLMVDSGGFVLMTKNDRGWSAERVAELYDKIDADHLVSLDVPPSGTDRNYQRCRKYDMTIRNLDLLLERFGNKVVPVVHGIGIAEIEQNCRRVAALCRSPSLIGLGGLVPTLQKCGAVRRAGENSPHRIVAEAVRCVQSFFPRSDIHLFGVGSLHTVLAAIAIGAHSVDSIGWRQAAGFGSVFIPGRHRRLLTHRQRETPCRPYANQEDIDLLAACACPECRHTGCTGANISLLTNHFKPRAAHNIWVLYSEAAAYLTAHRAGRGAEFLAARLSDAWLTVL
jgi:queuine/archaeosine tRNA-ribosyltransferase